MNAKRLTRRLRREVTANPKKAAVLGLLVLVALYFWAPLMWRWIARAGSRAKPVQAAATAKDTPPVPDAPAPMRKAGKGRNATTQDKKGSPDRAWDELARSIDQDPRMKPAGVPSISRDPFHAVAPEVAEKPKTEEMRAAEAAAAMTPEQLGLVLSSTLIGPVRRTALVNGRTYEQGGTIRCAKDGQPLEFTLSEVHPRRIVLTRQGKRYELTIAQPAVSGRIELYGSTNR